MLISSTAFASQRHLNDYKQVTNPKDWDAYKYALTQIIDGYVIFADDTEGGPLVGITKASLNTVRPGLPLTQLNTYSKGGVDCLKLIEEVTVQNREGFDTQLIKFQAVQCPGVNRL